MAGREHSKARAGQRSLSVLVVDDHPLWRETLAALLVSKGVAGVVHEAGDGRAAIEAARLHHPDVVVMDMQLPELNGVEATEAIRADVGCPVLMLCSSDERTDVLDAVRAGASGYLVKTAKPDEIVGAIRRVRAGEVVFSAEIATIVMDELAGRQRADHPLAALTDRERAVLALMAEGASNRAIADRLFLSQKTVEAHVSAIFSKLTLAETPDVHRRVQAVVTYLRSLPS